MAKTNQTKDFSALGLSEPVLKALLEIGYETPTPIQEQIIPYILSGKDVLGQAQTGTGKTAAFALPILSKIDSSSKHPQVLVLTPTRELAMQVAEAIRKYAKYLPGLRVLTVYGGQGYREQLSELRRGVQIVVGTPGRVMDHIRRETLDLSKLNCLVLDEADEMLRMGFHEDVDWILEHTPKNRQISLFSATIPQQIRRIANTYLNKPAEVTLKAQTSNALSIRQRYWIASGTSKLDALTRILEIEPLDGVICFVRTKSATIELADELKARGFSASAINGDIAQKDREKVIERLKNGKLDILVATDVAARGIDIDRISHVINYDIPFDTESYVHRIGRTGRAGRSGEAILFVAPRERRMFNAIERGTQQRIKEMQLPTLADISKKRIAQFKDKITQALSDCEELDLFVSIIDDYQKEHGVPAQKLAAALAKLVQGDNPLVLKAKERDKNKKDQKAKTKQASPYAPQRREERRRDNHPRYDRKKSHPGRDRRAS